MRPSISEMLLQQQLEDAGNRYLSLAIACGVTSLIFLFAFIIASIPAYFLFYFILALIYLGCFKYWKGRELRISILALLLYLIHTSIELYRFHLNLDYLKSIGFMPHHKSQSVHAMGLTLFDILRYAYPWIRYSFALLFIAPLLTYYKVKKNTSRIDN